MQLLRKKLGIVLGITTGIILLLVSAIFGTIHFLLDKDFVKDIIADQVTTYSKLDLRYQKVDSILFPLPGVQISGIKILDEKLADGLDSDVSQRQPIAEIEKLQVYWNVWALLQRKFELHSMNLEDGKIFLHRTDDGEFPILSKFKTDSKEIDELKDKIEDDSANSPDDIFSLLPRGLHVIRFNFEIQDDVMQRKDIIDIDEFSIELNRNNRMLAIELLGGVNSNHLEISSKLNFVENNWSYESARLKLHFESLEIELNKFIDYLVIFPKSNLEKSKLSVDFSINKNEKDDIEFELKKLNLNELLTNSKKTIEPVNFKTKLVFSKSKSEIRILDFSYIMGKLSQVSVQANMGFEKQNVIDANIESNSFDLDSTLSWVNQFSKVDISKLPKPKISSSRNTLNSNISSKNESSNESISKTKNENKPPKENHITVNLNLKNINLSGKFINSANGKIGIHNQLVQVKPLNLNLYDGKVNVTGKIDLSKRGQNSDFDIGTKNLNLAKLLKQLGQDKLITGNLDSETKLKLGLGNSSSVSDTIDAKSKFTIHKGELLGYANFIKPVAEIGKLINFESSNQGKSTAFHSINGDVHFSKGNLFLKEFTMLGVGVDAVGSGVYKKNGIVDMKFQASLSGRVGKAVKIPIIYKGIFGKNFAYLDPVWLASVYAGTIFFAGPAGTIVGGLAGSAASDTVNKTTDAVKGTFSSAKNFIFGSSKEEDPNPEE
ncbi:AsmA family protein [Leptospira sp. GIMC2001]|uniref:AsmA family protein n=1 Tax=Leptospira sp. GIMC2001 TaxID=1513297 RepID=UPI00234AF94B|nr:AsmA family protein [Leptospira sp. GIMC2001]WCL48773.1 AsmA family protein [Leptospira sp. GIMC2001]